MGTNYPAGLDAWDNPGPNDLEDDPDFWHDVMHGDVYDAIEAIEGELGINPSGTYSTVAQRLANTKPKEPQWTPVGTPTYADEFDADALDASWERVDPTGNSGHSTWTYGNGMLSVGHLGFTDAAGQMHCMLRPIGDAFAPGDAVVTCVRIMTSYADNHFMVGVGVTNGTTFGTSSIVQAQVYCNTTYASPGNWSVNANAGMNADSARGTPNNELNPLMGALWMRLVMTAANAWRMDVSPDGVTWWIGGTLSYSLTPTHMGFFISSWNTAVVGVASFQCFRRYSGVS